MNKMKTLNKIKLITCILVIVMFVGICVINKIWTAEEKNKSTSVDVRSDNEFNESSKIKIDNLNKKQEENLFKLCKVWGFLKYYHPEVANGQYNWDYELFRIMPKILEADNGKKVDKILSEWIESLGEFKKGNYEKGNKKVKIQPSTGWIKDTKFVSSHLSNLLCNIENGERSENNYYGNVDRTELPFFKNEKQYSAKIETKDQGYNLLLLFRYWNIIEYYFPYKNIIDYSWDSILQEFIPKFVNCNDELEYRLNFYKLIGKIQDNHATMLMESIVDKKFFGNNIATVETKLIEDKLVVTRTLSQLNTKVNIKVGDVILKIDGKNVSDVIEEKLKYIPKANRISYRYEFTNYLMRTNSDELEVSIQRGEERFNEKLNCINTMNVYKEQLKQSHEIIKNNIGYIYPGTLNKGEIDSIMNKFKDTKGLIIDLRCYPSDFIVYSLGKYLMEKPKECTIFTKPNKLLPGEFVEDKPILVGEVNKDYYKGKVIIIINEQTISQPEFTAMALRCAPNATIIGSNSVGADGNVVRVPLTDSIYTYFSGYGVYYPDGRETQRIGIIPDIEVKPTIEGVRNGRDELMEKAIELINN